MKIKPFTTIAILVFIALFTQSCSTTQSLPLVTESTAVKRTQALAVIGIHWIEEYNDTETKTIITRKSEDLFTDKENLARKKQFPGKTVLYDPLTYLANIRLIASQDKDNDQLFSFVKFNLDLEEYFDNTIHAIPPGEYRLHTLRMDQYKLFLGDNNDPDINKWKKFGFKSPLPEIAWELQAGTISYLGDITLFFKTKKMSFGLAPPEDVIEKVEITRIIFSDKLEKVVEKFKVEKPWFPVDQIQNQSKTGDWQWDEVREIWQEYEAPKDLPKRDTKKFFF